jgi:adhesin/invasin
MILRGFRRSWARNARLGALVASLAVLAACDKVPLTAPTESTIALSAAGSSVPANGSVDIVATVTEKAGTAAQNGTVVTFTTTLGTITPAEARTNNGKVTVRLSADGRSGKASVIAFSGASKSDALELPIGAAAATNIVLTASPSTVPAGGGAVLVTALVRDASGNALPSVPVTFSTDAGTLTATSVQTDANGQATTTLSTTRDATVKATAGTVDTTVSVKVNPAPTVTVSVSPSSPIVGQPAVFTVTVTPATNGSPVESLRLEFGDGASQNLGSSSTSVSHRYTRAGTFTVRATVTDTAGQQSSQVLVIIVTEAAPLAVTLDISPSSPNVGDIVTFTATATPATGVSITSYTWNFGDNKTATTTGNRTTHIYSRTQTVRASVTVEGSDGSTGQASADVKINP